MKKTGLLVWWIIVIFFIFSVIGCGPDVFDYSFELGNNCEKGEVAIIIMSKQGFHLQSNHIVAKTWKTYHGPFKYSPNGQYFISWIDENGDQYSAEADFRTAISKKFQGYLIFKIDSQNNLIYSVSHSYKGDEFFSKVSRGKKEKKLTPSKSGKTSGLTEVNRRESETAPVFSL